MLHLNCTIFDSVVFCFYAQARIMKFAALLHAGRARVGCDKSSLLDCE